MKMTSLIRPLSAVAVYVLLVTTSGTLAQTSTIPFVTVQATDNHATWTGDPGTFTIFRHGNPTPALNVYCCISGTASDGVDYQSIGNFVPLASGVLSNSIVIHPINHGQTDLKTVTVQLCPSPLMSPVNYYVSSPDSATVYITRPDVTNLPPQVRLVNPTNGAVFYNPVNIALLARASDPNGSVTNVEFFAGATDLGHGQLVVLDPPGVNGVVGPVYFFNWNNVQPDNYSLTAVASDDGGLSNTSDPVKITVLPGPPPPHTNRPPVVRITSPPNGSVFRGPLNLPLFAYAFDADGFVRSVEFDDGTNAIGFGHKLSGVSSPTATVVSSNFWELTWSNAPVGIHALTALATDNSNAVTRSWPVLITILPSPPPPTNRPPIVSIVASDPVAIEGTNCWPWLGLSSTNPTWSAWTSPTAVCHFITNCGPKNATFTIRRHGDTNGDLTVNYDIGGTATNGVDYLTLPGAVTIPAGERSALISIVPLDDGPPDITSTVWLKLMADTNSPLAYLLGYPRSAAAIILDGPWPRPVTGLLADKCFHLAATGPDGAWFHIEYSEDLAHWNSICTNQVINGSIDFVDPDAPNAAGRFYRAVPESNPPPE